MLVLVRVVVRHLISVVVGDFAFPALHVVRGCGRGMCAKGPEVPVAVRLV